MKKFLFLLCFLTLGALTTMNAQTEGKKCSKKDAKCCAKKASSTAATTSVAAATATKDAKACSKTAAKSGKACCAKGKKTSVAGVVMTASEAAKADESIEERVCSKSGNASYYQKAECPMSGKVSYTQVRYDMESSKFVNVAPSDEKAKEAKLKECSKAKATSCKKEVKSAKVVKTSVKE